MRPIPARASFSRGSASRRRQCFATSPVTKKPETPAKTEQ